MRDMTEPENVVFNVKERMEALEGQVEPKFPLTVRVLVPYEKRFETQEDFEKYLRHDVLVMGYAVEEDGELIVEDDDRKAWRENYGDVPFPPKTVQDYVGYTKKDIDEARYGFEEIDFEMSGDFEHFQWMIQED